MTRRLSSPRSSFGSYQDTHTAPSRRFFVSENGPAIGWLGVNRNYPENHTRLKFIQCISLNINHIMEPAPLSTRALFQSTKEALTRSSPASQPGRGAGGGALCTNQERCEKLRIKEVDKKKENQCKVHRKVPSKSREKTTGTAPYYAFKNIVSDACLFSAWCCPAAPSSPYEPPSSKVL